MTLFDQKIFVQIGYFLCLSLRGLGFKDAAIKRLYQPEKILARLTKFLRETSLP